MLAKTLLVVAVSLFAAVAAAEVAVNAGAGVHASVTAAPAPGDAGTRAPGEPEPQWVEIPPDQPVPQGSHVRLDISTGKRWVNVATYGNAAAAGRLPTHDAAKHDHGLVGATETTARRGRVGDAVAVTTTAKSNDTAAAAGADDEVVPTAGGAAAALLAQHSKSFQQKVHGVMQLQNMDQKLHDPTAPSNADHAAPSSMSSKAGSGEPKMNAHGLDELLARGLYRQSQLDDDFATLRKRLAIVISPTASVSAIEQALEDLEDSLHDRANAIEFSAPTSAAVAGPMHGLRYVLNWLHADTKLSLVAGLAVANAGGSTELALLRLRMRAAWLVGTTVQNNDKAQGFALADGALLALINAFALSAPPAAKPPANADPAAVQALANARLDMDGKLLYALSSLLRASGEAKKQFLAQHGVGQLQVLVARHTDPDAPKATEQRRFDVIRKVVSLIRDVLSDHQFDPTFSHPPLIAELSTPAVCKTLAALVFLPSDVVREQLLHVMHLQLHAGAGCRADYTSPTVIEAVDRLSHHWDARHHNATHTTVPGESHHTHPDGDESYELELYHVAQAFLHAARNPAESVHDHSHDEYDIALGQKTASAASSSVAAGASRHVGVIGTRPTDPNAKAPAPGDSHVPVEHEYEADDEAPHPDSKVEHTGEHDGSGGDDEEEEEEDDSSDPTTARKYKPRRPKQAYDPDADSDEGFDEQVHRAVRAAATSAGDAEVDGDADAKLDDDGADDEEEHSGHSGDDEDEDHDGPVHESGFPYNPRASHAA